MKDVKGALKFLIVRLPDLFGFVICQVASFFLGYQVPCYICSTGSSHVNDETSVLVPDSIREMIRNQADVNLRLRGLSQLGYFEGFASPRCRVATYL